MDEQRILTQMKLSRKLSGVVMAVSMTITGYSASAAASAPLPEVCHGSAAFNVNIYQRAGISAVEEPKVGVCNNNAGYQSRFRLTASCSGCGQGGLFLAYQARNGVYNSLLTRSQSFVNGPIFSDGFKNAPLGFWYAPSASFIGTVDTISLSGPWSNYGF